MLSWLVSLHNSLVFNLVVEVSSKPVIKERLFNITSSNQLHRDPILALVRINVHGQMVGLC